jgi:hypothetical protein
VSLWFDKPQAVDIPFDHFAGCISAGINCNVDTMRIALVVDERTNLWHSVLIVNIAGQILVLDNREASVRPAADFSHFRPLMAMKTGGSLPISACVNRSRPPRQQLISVRRRRGRRIAPPCGPPPFRPPPCHLPGTTGCCVRSTPTIAGPADRRPCLVAVQSGCECSGRVRA